MARWKCLALGDKMELVTIAEKVGNVRSSVGPQTVADYDFTNAPALDLILIPGVNRHYSRAGKPGLDRFSATTLPAKPDHYERLHQSALLAKAGLLDGLAATTNKMFFELARTQGANVDWRESARWVDAGQYVTSSGVSAGTDMALAVIQRIFGAELAEMVMNYTEYQWHRDADHDPFAQLLNQGALPG